MARQSEWQLLGLVIRAVIVSTLLLYVKESGLKLCFTHPKQMSNVWT